MVAQAEPTRQRLLQAATSLFAERGFHATTVGDIERAVGLQPRRGGLYKHFASKEAVLEQAVEQHLDAIRLGAAQLDLLDDATIDLDATALGVLLGALGRWLLDELDSQRPLIAIFEREGDRLPDLRDRFRTELINVGYAAAATLLARAGQHSRESARALAVVLVGSLINTRRDRWTFGATALDLGDDVLLEAWTSVALATTGLR